MDETESKVCDLYVNDNVSNSDDKEDDDKDKYNDESNDIQNQEKQSMLNSN